MTIEMFSLPKEVETDAEPTSPVKGPEVMGNGDSKYKKISAINRTKQQQQQQQQNNRKEKQVKNPEKMVIYEKEESMDDSIATIEDLHRSAEKKLSLMNNCEESVYVPKGWSEKSQTKPLAKEMKECSFSSKLPNIQMESIQSCSLNFESGQLDSITNKDELDHSIQKKLELIESPPDKYSVPEGWSESEKCSMKNDSKSSEKEVRKKSSSTVTSKESSSPCVENPVRRIQTAPFPVNATDFEVKLRAEDYEDMPRSLRTRHGDIFLITSSKDIYEGMHLKELMEQVDIKLPDEEKTTKCRVYLLNDINQYSSKISSLEEAQKKCTYVFILLTKNFCQDKEADFQKDDTLVRSITTLDRRWGIVPVYTQPKRYAPPDKTYEIPSGLISFKGLDMSRLLIGKDSIEEIKSLTDGDNYFHKGLTGMLEARIQQRIVREAQQEEEKAEWVEQKKKQRRKEILIEQHQKRLEMERDEREFQNLLQNLPKELPARPQKPAESYFKAEEPIQEPRQRPRPTPTQSSGSAPHQPRQPAFTPNPHCQAPFMGYPQMPMLNPQQMCPPEMQQQMFLLQQQLLQMQNQMQMNPQQPMFQPQPIPPFFQPPVMNPYMMPPHSQPAAPQPVQPPAAANNQQAAGVNNYYIQASNVQVGSQSTMVTQEQSQHEEDEADALAQKYDPDDEPVVHQREPYLEPQPQAPPEQKVGIQSPPEVPAFAGTTYMPKPEFMQKGRRSPQEVTEAQIPDHLPNINLVLDDGSSDRYNSQSSEEGTKRKEPATQFDRRPKTPSETSDWEPQPEETVNVNELGIVLRSVEEDQESGKQTVLKTPRGQAVFTEDFDLPQETPLNTSPMTFNSSCNAFSQRC